MKPNNVISMEIMLRLLLLLQLCRRQDTSAFRSNNVMATTKNHPMTTKNHPMNAVALLVKRRASIAAGDKTRTTVTHLCAHADRRQMMIAASTTLGLVVAGTAFPPVAKGGIDVSGLPVAGGGGGGAASSPNSDLANQLRQSQYNDGSAARRVQDMRTDSTTPPPNPAAALANNINTSRRNDSPPVGVATWALRATEPVLGKLNFGVTTRYQGRIVGPPSTPSISVNFDFPADWLQLDRANGCIQFVDQRNGDKLYLLRVTLPAETSLATVSKRFFAEALFDPAGSLVRSGGLTVEDARVSKDITSTDCRDTTVCGRRLMLKFATVTGNGLRVERRGLLQAYPVPGDNNDVYMMVTSSNAVKFEQGGIERDTVENIINSFRIEFA
jgi:hypothetical protein